LTHQPGYVRLGTDSAFGAKTRHRPRTTRAARRSSSRSTRSTARSRRSGGRQV